MKKKIFMLLAALLLLGLCGCGSKLQGTAAGSAVSESTTSAASDSQQSTEQSEEESIDLTKLSSTMVYSEVYNMMTEPEDYIGKMVTMQGQFAMYEDPESGEQYFACIIKDATACCSQGLEFVLQGSPSYPDDYPELGTEITVVGIFEVYGDEEGQYCRLKDAKLAE